MNIPPHAGALDKTQKAKGDGQGLMGAWAACFFSLAWNWYKRSVLSKVNCRSSRLQPTTQCGSALQATLFKWLFQLSEAQQLREFWRLFAMSHHVTKNPRSRGSFSSIWPPKIPKTLTLKDINSITLPDFLTYNYHLKFRNAFFKDYIDSFWEISCLAGALFWLVMFQGFRKSTLPRASKSWSRPQWSRPKSVESVFLTEKTWE